MGNWCCCVCDNGKVIRLLLFDVNDTLLDISELKPELHQIFGNSVTVREFYLECLQHALVLNAVGDYRTWGELARGVLEMTAAGRHVAMGEEAKVQVLQKLKALPPHPDVKPGLEQLRRSGFRLATLTNSSTDGQREQLQNAGLTDYFDQTLSVDAVRKYKPAPETYRYALGQTGLPAEEVMMVAAHPWDIWGAMTCGLGGALLTRQGKAPFPLAPAPTVQAPNLVVLAERLGSIKVH